MNEEFKVQFEKKVNYKNEGDIELQIGSSTISFEREHLKFIKAEGNYIAMHFIGDEKAVPILHRATITELNLNLIEYPEFFKCHRSYIINLNAVEYSIGNSQGLHLKMINDHIKIPVSRPKIKLLKQYLEKTDDAQF
ncbi:MAG: hypothetical protein Aureis2KO_27500 [Aureisphaera sp.]